MTRSLLFGFLFILFCKLFEVYGEPDLPIEENVTTNQKSKEEVSNVTYVPDVGEELQYTFSCEKDDPDFFHSQMEAFFKKLNLDWNKVDLSNLSLIEKNIKNTNKVYAGVNIRLCKTKNGNFVVLKSTEKCINSEVVTSSSDNDDSKNTEHQLKNIVARWFEARNMKSKDNTILGEVNENKRSVSLITLNSWNENGNPNADDNEKQKPQLQKKNSLKKLLPNSLSRKFSIGNNTIPDAGAKNEREKPQLQKPSSLNKLQSKSFTENGNLGTDVENEKQKPQLQKQNSLKKLLQNSLSRKYSIDKNTIPDADVENKKEKPQLQKQNSLIKPLPNSLTKKNSIGKNTIPDADCKKILDQILVRTNKYRTKFRVQELIMDQELNNDAQDWANNLIVKNKFEYTPDESIGQTIFETDSYYNLGETAVDGWYYEMIFCNPKATGKEIQANKKIYNLVQLLWEETRRLGCGVGKRNNNTFLVVCNYSPSVKTDSDFKRSFPSITKEDVDEARRLKEKTEKNDNNDSVELPKKPFKRSLWNFITCSNF